VIEKKAKTGQKVWQVEVLVSSDEEIHDQIGLSESFQLLVP